MKKNKTHPPRPKGMPKAVYAEMCKHPPGSKRAVRFLDGWFSNNGGSGIGVQQTNSGSQNYGIGNTSGKRSRNLSGIFVDSGSNNNPGSTPTPTVLTSVTTSKMNKTLVFQEREMFTAVNGSNTFFSQAFAINPGLQSMFPKGSQICENYEKYRVTSLELEYVPIVSGYSGDGQQGRIVLGFSPDPLESPPSDLQSAESMDPNVSGMPYDRLRLRLTPSQYTGSQPQRYVRTSRNPAGTDLKTYDPGVFYYTVQGTVNSTQIGELHITYTFELQNIRVAAAPILPPNQTYLYAAFPFVSGRGSANTYVADVSAPNYIADGIGVSQYVIPATGTIWRFPPGRYMVSSQFDFEAPGGTVSVAGWLLCHNSQTVLNPYGTTRSISHVLYPAGVDIMSGPGWDILVVEDNVGDNGLMFFTHNATTAGVASYSMMWRVLVVVL